MEKQGLWQSLSIHSRTQVDSGIEVRGQTYCTHEIVLMPKKKESSFMVARNVCAV